MHGSRFRPIRFDFRSLAIRLLPVRYVVTGSLAIGSILSIGTPSGECIACPFCSAVSQTFAEEMASMDVVVLATFVDGIREAVKPGSTDETPKSTFRVVDCLKGDTWIKPDEEITAEYFGKPDKRAAYLIMGTDPPSLMWSRPLAMSAVGKQYLLDVAKLPKDKTRLKFFLKYLENDDEMLARDAYDEFAKAPYEDVLALKPDIDRQQMVNWIQDKDVPVSRRRLYLTMLGVAGDDSDAEMLEQFMMSDDRKQKAGLDAMIACYITLRGDAALPVVEELFLGNKTAEYSDTYAAIMAYRFHGTEGKIVDRDKLLPGLRKVLDRPDLADLVIPDLARWEDWQTMPKLVALFKGAKKNANWVRVPVVNYLRACPLPEAAVEIEQLAKIDPEAIKRANVFFPFSKPGAKQRANAADGSRSDAEESGGNDEGETGPNVEIERPAPVQKRSTDVAG